MASFAIALMYGLVLLISFIGWGSILGRALAPQSNADWGLRASWGVSLTVVAGGGLNLASLGSRNVIIAYVVAGVGLCIIDWFIRGRSCPPVRDRLADRLVLFGFLISLGIIAFRYAAAASFADYNKHDDYQAYFVFPEKLVQTGTLGIDPFSERRLVTSLGGQYFLDALTLSALDFSRLALLDRGVGLILLAGIVWGLLRERRVRPRLAIGILLAIALTQPLHSNITGTLIATVFIVSVYRTALLAFRSESTPIQSACLLGVVAAGGASMKMTMVPMVGLLLGALFFAQLIRGKRRQRTMLQVFVAGAVTLAALFPWMLDSYHSGGTLLYPILGKGYHGSVYGGFAVATSAITLRSAPTIIASGILLTFPVMLLAWAGIAFSCRSFRETLRMPLFFVAGAFLASIAVTLATGGSYIERYSYPVLFAAALIAVSEMAVDSMPAMRPFALAFIAFFAGAAWVPFRIWLPIGGNDIAHALHRSDRPPKTESKNYRTAQAAVPPGETILTRVLEPFRFDFRRNRIFIADYPGGASPPPGMPSFEGPEPLARYLLAEGIRYVAYSYAAQADFTRAAFGDRLDPRANPWLRSEALHTFDFQENLAALGSTRGRAYDDGKIFVIDLSQPIGGTAVQSEGK